MIGSETKNFFVAPPPGQPIDFEFVWANAPLGRHVLTAQTRDADGALGVSEPVLIAVVSTNPPPVTNLPPLVSIVARDAFASETRNPTNPNPAVFVILRSGPTTGGSLPSSPRPAGRLR